MGFVDKIKGKLSSSSTDKRASTISPTTPANPASATPANNATTYASEPVAEDDPPRSKSIETGTGGRMTTYTGVCHCKHHEWTVELTPDQSKHILCHCDTCKILGGGAYTMNQIIPKSALNITKGGEPSKYTYYGDSGKAVNCYYCPHCTTHIYHHQEVMGPDTIVARTGLLKEGRDKFPVGAEIFGKAKMSWEPKIAETFETLPPE
ncbi:unnamed protein product [Cercospora beticola]|nr:unnamed protein product [Cercospora beticola]